MRALGPLPCPPPQPRGAPAATTAVAHAFNATTFALSLLLVFKTNSSYARW